MHSVAAGSAKIAFQDSSGCCGVVRDAQAVRDAVARIEDWVVATMRWQLLGTVASPITGSDGNREYLLAARNVGV